MVYLASIDVRYWPSDSMEPASLMDESEENSRYEIVDIDLEPVTDPGDLPDESEILSESYDPAESDQGYEWVEDIYGLFVKVSEDELNGKDPETVAEEKIKKSNLPKVLQKYGWEKGVLVNWKLESAPEWDD